jgi:hypothetical protein
LTATRQQTTHSLMTEKQESNASHIKASFAVASASSPSYYYAYLPGQRRYTTNQHVA